VSKAATAATGAGAERAGKTHGTTRPANRSEMILRAAGALFAERGYAAASVDEIGAAVGITGPAIYSHFRSKDHLLAALLEQALDAIDDALEAAVSSSASPRDALDAFLHGTIRVATEQSYLAGLYVHERHHLSDIDRRRLERKRRAIFRTEVELLRQLRPDLGRDQIQLRLFVVVSGMLGSLSEFRTGLDVAAVADELHRMAIAALLVD